MAKKKLGFSLSGGGARGIAHAGFLQAMEEADIKPQVITGCSMGAVVGGCYSAGVPTTTLKKVLCKMTKNDLLDLNINPLRNRSVFAGKKMQGLLEKYVGSKDIKDLPIVYGCIASDLISGKVVNLTQGDLVTAIKASACVPALFNPVETNGKLLVDGGLLLRNPIRLAKKLGADIIVGVDVIGALPDFACAKSIMDIGARSFTVIDNLYCAKLGVKSANLMVYPKLDGVSIFKFDNLKLAYERGYEAGKNSISQVEKLLA